MNHLEAVTIMGFGRKYAVNCVSQNDIINVYNKLWT